MWYNEKDPAEPGQRMDPAKMDNTKLNDAVKALIVRGLTAQRTRTTLDEIVGDGRSEIAVTVKQLKPGTVKLAHDEVSGVSSVWELTVTGADLALVRHTVDAWKESNP